MTWLEAVFWLESIAYDVELSTPAVQGETKEVHDLSELAQILPKAESKQNGVEHQG
jgi:hypothetical protein